MKILRSLSQEQIKAICINIDCCENVIKNHPEAKDHIDAAKITAYDYIADIMKESCEEYIVLYVKSVTEIFPVGQIYDEYSKAVEIAKDAIELMKESFSDEGDEFEATLLDNKRIKIVAKSRNWTEPQTSYYIILQVGEDLETSYTNNYF